MSNRFLTWMSRRMVVLKLRLTGTSSVMSLYLDILIFSLNFLYWDNCRFTCVWEVIQIDPVYLLPSLPCVKTIARSTTRTSTLIQSRSRILSLINWMSSKLKYFALWKTLLRWQKDKLQTVRKYFANHIQKRACL